jgi:hypothetical protein
MDRTAAAWGEHPPININGTNRWSVVDVVVLEGTFAVVVAEEDTFEELEVDGFFHCIVGLGYHREWIT